MQSSDNIRLEIKSGIHFIYNKTKKWDLVFEEMQNSGNTSWKFRVRSSLFIIKPKQCDFCDPLPQPWLLFTASPLHLFNFIYFIFFLIKNIFNFLFFQECLDKFGDSLQEMINYHMVRSCSLLVSPVCHTQVLEGEKKENPPKSWFHFNFISFLYLFVFFGQQREEMRRIWAVPNPFFWADLGWIWAVPKTFREFRSEEDAGKGPGWNLGWDWIKEFGNGFFWELGMDFFFNWEWFLGNWEWIFR